MEPSFFEIKKCTKCGEEKPETRDFFRRHKKGKNGLYAHCKMCCSIMGREYRHNNPEKIRELGKRYIRKNIEERREATKKWRQINKERVKVARKEWEKNNPEKVKEKEKRHRKRRLNTLTDAIVRQRLGLLKDQCPPGLIEVKRLQLKIYRLCKTSKS